MKNINTLIKRTFIAAAFALSATSLNAQFVTIPDPAFVAYLQTNFPSAMSGNQMDTTNIAITNALVVNSQGLGISDITGIEFFDSLDSLNCANNNLSTLPKLPLSLRVLACSNNSISCLPALPNNLQNLYALGNSLTCIPNMPTSSGGFFSDIGTTLCYGLVPGVSDILISCNNACDGALSVATSVAGNFDWVWSNGYVENNVTASLQGSLCAGTYTITATPTGGGCVALIERTLFNPTQLNLSANTTNISCGGANDGSISLSGSGGTPPYLFSIGGTYQPSGFFSNLAAGNYVASVLDANGCATNIIVSLTQPAALILAPLPDQAVCYGTSFIVCISAFGGTPPYNYQLEINGNPIPGFMPCDSFVVTTNSTFSITVTDANGCIATDVFNVTVFPPLVLGIQTNVIACNFPVQICIPQVTGGSPPYSYLWGTGDMTQCINSFNSGAYGYTVVDVNGCSVGSSTTVTYSPGWQFMEFAIDSLPDCGQCNGGLTINLFGGAGGPVTYQWSNGITTQFSNGVCDNQNGYVIATDTNNCVDTAFYKLDCFSVWPGDANNDGVANNADILPIGIGYGTMGNVRPNATINWQAENNLNWIDTLASNTNYKHIDCNGDGIIADDDTIAILQNFGFTHPLRIAQRLQNITDPPLYFDIVVDTVGTGQQLDIPLYFGTSAIPADSIYGMAFTVNYDTSLVKADSVQIGFSPSWLGTSGSDLIYISKNDAQNGKLFVGVTRINQNDTSGFGEIARVTVVTTDNVSGKLSQSIYDTLNFSISDLTIINVNEIERNAFVTGDSLIIEDLTALNELNQLGKNIFVFPNPAKNNVNIKSSFAELVSVRLTDVTGKQINNLSNTNNPLIKKLNDFEFRININNLQKGMYLIKIETNSGTITKQFAVTD